MRKKTRVITRNLGWRGVAVRFHHQSGVVFFLFFRSGIAALFVLRVAHQPFDMPEIVAILSPVALALFFDQLRSECNHFAHGIPQQINIGWKVHIRFNHKEIGSLTQGFVFFFLPEYDHHSR